MQTFRLVIRHPGVLFDVQHQNYLYLCYFLFRHKSGGFHCHIFHSIREKNDHCVSACVIKYYGEFILLTTLILREQFCIQKCVIRIKKYKKFPHIFTALSRSVSNKSASGFKSRSSRIPKSCLKTKTIKDVCTSEHYLHSTLNLRCWE